MADRQQGCALWMWENTGDVWAEIQQHPFLVELEAGTLPDEKLRFYFEQNFQYVDEVYKARLVAASKAPDKKTFDLLTRDWNLEPSDDRQGDLLELFGGDRDNLPPMAPACRGYTYHMWYNALNGRTIDWLASFVACPWTYDLIGERISGNIGEERRENWMEYYGSDVHHDLMVDFRDAIDRLSTGFTDDDRDRLLDKWRLGMRYEWMFWDDAYHMRGWPI
jgi:thiaminase/transcriptional activator TenA